MATDSLLEVRDLTTRFRTSRGSLLAVDHVSLTIDAGETVGIVGESGSGKSVLVRSIMGLLDRNATVDPAAQVLLDGRDVGRLTRAEARHFFGVEMAMVFQDPMTSLNPVRKIGHQITDPLRHHLGLDRDAARERAIDLLTRVGIPAPARRLDQYPHELSGGMRQRVTIAIALSCNPKLLLADEPTTALDVTVQKQILDLLTQLRHDLGMSMILITHDLGVVAGTTDRICVMYAGRLVETAPTTELFAHPRHPYTEALMQSIPRVEYPSHTRLRVVAGRPPDMVHPPPGCRFAPRCPSARPKCLDVDPGIITLQDGTHQAACHFQVGTPEGDEARAANLAAGRTAAGLELDPEMVG